MRVLFTWTALLGFLLTHSQRYSISQILDTIQVSNAIVRMYDADIRSMDEAANGARSWMPPEVGAGLFMTPYNTKRWKAMDNGSYFRWHPTSRTFRRFIHRSNIRLIHTAYRIITFNAIQECIQVQSLLRLA